MLFYGLTYFLCKGRVYFKQEIYLFFCNKCSKSLNQKVVMHASFSAGKCSSSWWEHGGVWHQIGGIYNLIYGAKNLIFSCVDHVAEGSLDTKLSVLIQRLLMGKTKQILCKICPFDPLCDSLTPKIWKVSYLAENMGGLPIPIVPPPLMLHPWNSYAALTRANVWIKT